MKILKSVNLFQTWGESKLKHQQQQDKCDSKHPEETRPLIILQSRKCFYLIPESFRSSGATTRVNDLILHLRFVEICWVVFCVKLLTNQPTIKPQIRMKTEQNLQERWTLLRPRASIWAQSLVCWCCQDQNQNQNHWSWWRRGAALWAGSMCVLVLPGGARPQRAVPPHELPRASADTKILHLPARRDRRRAGGRPSALGA